MPNIGGLYTETQMNGEGGGVGEDGVEGVIAIIITDYSSLVFV